MKDGNPAPPMPVSAMQPIALPGPDALAFRKAMSSFATGVAIITAQAGDVPHGMTVNSLTSVSLDPCLVLFCTKRGGATAQAVRDAGHFGINILRLDQRDLCRRFTGPLEERFEGVDIVRTPSGVPLIADALTWLACKVAAIHPAGDHDIVLGEVTGLHAAGGAPLVFHGGRYGKFVARPAPVAVASA
jgi:3-hydroxy-9,10-secoandrosta-1,3,5(10)-triene-9,17-dione monooxygenase reductase component